MKAILITEQILQVGIHVSQKKIKVGIHGDGNLVTDAFLLSNSEYNILHNSTGLQNKFKYKFIIQKFV